MLRSDCGQLQELWLDEVSVDLLAMARGISNKACGIQTIHLQHEDTGVEPPRKHEAWVALANAVHAVPHTLHIHVDTHDAVISVYACLFDALRSSHDREARAS